MGLDAKNVIKKLSDKGVGSRPFFYPMHQQPALRSMGLFQGESHPVSENMYRYGLYLPSGMTLSAEQILSVVKVLKQILLESFG